MGMYTELILGAKLKKETPVEVINTLQYLCGEGEEPKDFILKNERNPIDGSGSYYFAVDRPVFKMWNDELIGGQWTISSRCNIKNYTNEIETLLEYLKPHIESGSGTRDFYAITCYEEDSEPTIHYLR